MDQSGSPVTRRDAVAASEEAAARSRIARAVGRAQLVLLWEALWPRLAPLLALAALFAAVSWFGLWRLTSLPVRYGVLAVFGLAALYLLVRLARFALPSEPAALARVEQATGTLHRPASAFSDSLATAPDDATGRTLWLAHRRRLLASLDRLKAGLPSPGLAGRDPYALRFLAVLIAAVGFVYAGPEREQRLAEAFHGGESLAATVARIDAWVTPPNYTGRAPIFLTGAAAKMPEGGYSVPAGSVVTVRTGGTHDLDVVSTEGDAAPVKLAAEPASGPNAEAAPVEHRLTLARPAEVSVERGGVAVSQWRFAVEPDNAPRITWAKPPAPTQANALSLSYSVEDDYGVVAASAEISPPDQAAGAATARPLVPAPTVPLSLPQLRARSGAAETVRDLTSHPWAGAKVKITLAARDEAGQEGRSDPAEVQLPSRFFSNPLARAVVEQRAKLALDANQRDRVADALDAITVAPAESGIAASPYLGIRTAYYRLLNARDDDELRGVVDYLWAVALGIEDGDLSLTAQALRAAQDALRQALENGASDAEIKRLTDQLRDAMQKYLQALAQQAQRNPQISSLPPNAQTLRPQDLQRMLDRIEQLAQTGARDAAREMLSQLQNMLDNLQAGRPMQGNPQASQMMESLNQLGDMIRRQQSLLDRTYRADRGMNPDGGQQGQMTPGQLQDALKQLQESQKDLQGQLQQLLDQLKQMGVDPNGKLGQAGDAMGDAEKALGQGKSGPAVGSQGQALDALRQGAQGLAQSLANAMGQGQGQGQGQGNFNGMPGGFRGGGDNFANTDPLGRPRSTTGPDLGTTVKVPDEIDTQRAREILDTIRKRLGLPDLPAIEHDYLERLLDRF